MGHHGHHHHGHHDQQQESYGAYPGSSNSGYYDAANAAPYGYQQPPQSGYGGYGYGEQPSPYAEAVPYGVYGSAQPSSYGVVQPYPQNGNMQSVNQLLAQEKKHKNHEHLAEAVAVGAGTFAAYEHHEAKVDPLHAARHQREEHAAEAVAVGAVGYALYEHHQSRDDHQQLEAAGYYAQHGKHGHDHHGHDHHKHRHHQGLLQ